MKFQNDYFHPPWWATVLTLMGVILFVKLSFWQWHRYHEKKILQESYITKIHAAPIALNKFLAEEHAIETNHNPSLVYKKIYTTGRYDAHQFLWDNRIQNGQVGFDVITPLKLANTQTILVNRGFVPANASRKILMNIEPPRTPVSIEGLLTLPEKTFVLGSIVEKNQGKVIDWPLKIMRVDPKILSTALNKPLLPYVILLDPNSLDGFGRQWALPNLWAERSLGYCFQWLAFALLALILYVIMNFK